MKSWKLGIGGLSLVIISFAALTFRWGCQTNVDITIEQQPPAHLMGWNEDLAKSEETQLLIAQMPPFQIDGVKRDNSQANVRLWEYAEEIGVDPATFLFRQEIGDCVSFGWSNGTNFLQCVQIALGQQAEFRPSFQPYIYGTSRVQIGEGRLGNSDGSVGAWAAKAVQQYGILAADDEGVPKYAGSIAKQWGRTGPPKQFISIAQETLIKTVSPVQSAADVRDSICNGYPVPICSNAGFGSINKSHDRQVGRWTTSWGHCMCLTAYDGSEDGRKAGGGEPVYYCQNSWGPNAHPKPLQGEPAGGFWIRESDVEKIVQQGDSYAISSFVGFPSQDLDFRIFSKQASKRKGIRRDEKQTALAL